MVPDIAKSGHSFKGAMAYYLHDKAQEAGPKLATAERVAWTETRNLATNGPHTATRIMIATAQRADELKAGAGVKNTGRKSNAHVYAYSLAWHPDEAGKLDKAEMLRAVDQSLKALGAEQHQAVIICHRDQKHPHVHVVLNRVHPDTGKMLSTSNDRLKLSDWANRYERERGQILTPAREEKRQARQQFRQAAADRSQKSPATATQRAAQSDRPKSEAAALKELSDAQKARHKAEWPALSAKDRAARNAIYSDFGARIKAATVQHKEATRSIWAAHFKQERTYGKNFQKNEGNLRGIIHNALVAAKYQQATGQAPGRGTLALTFAAVFSAEARTQAFKALQDVSRATLARELKAVLDRDIAVLKEQRGNALATQRGVFGVDRAALIARQDLERAKVREGWRQVYERRGKDPRYQAWLARRDAGRAKITDAGTTRTEQPAHFQTPSEIRAAYKTAAGLSLAEKQQRSQSRGRGQIRSRTRSFDNEG